MPKSSTPCFHCQLPIDEKGSQITTKIENQKQHFCCTGCSSVCQAIYHSGMKGFYSRSADIAALAPPPTINRDYKIYDLPEVQEEWVRLEGKQLNIQLLVEGIHCAACVWLIENRLAQIDGVIKANVNLSARSLSLTWDKNTLLLSTALKHLAQIGYNAVPYDPDVAEGALKKRNQNLLYRLGFAGFAAMNLMWIAIALYSGADQGEHKRFFYWISFLVATPTLIYSGYPFFKGAIIGLKNKHLTMDLPIVIGALSTWSYSVYVTLFNINGAEVYFDTVVNFIFVLLVGRFLESTSKRKAVSTSQRLLDLQPKIASLLINKTIKVVPIKSIKINDLVLVKPGERIPVDGIIVKGQSEIDEAMMTGESYPVTKKEQDSVHAGTNNKNGVLEIRVTAYSKNSALAKIVHLVDQAQSSKAPIQRTADKVVPWFVFITLLLSLITFLWWLPTSFEIALMAATSVLIITCPCALGLATPMSIAVSTGVAANLGVLIKNGGVLETLSTIEHFVFDKTGTLTEGNINVSSVVDYSTNMSQILNSAMQLEQQSEHPVAKAIVSHVNKVHKNVNNDEVQNIKIIVGEGISATINKKQIIIGNETLVSQHCKIKPLTVEVGLSVVYCYLEGAGYVAFILEDTIRENAKEIINQLHSQAIKVTLLSGDKKSVAQHIAAKLGIKKCLPEVKPDEKQQTIKQLQQQGKLIAMVGDGINDAPALMQADVGIAMGTGTDISMDSADIILMDGQLAKLPLVSKLSKRTLLTIKQNIALSIVYNIVMIPLAMMAMITPLIAAIAMPISSLLVIANASRIRWYFMKNKLGR